MMSRGAPTSLAPVDAARLASFPILAPLGEEVRTAIAEVAHEQAFDAGDTITRTGEFGYHLWFIEEGEVEVVRRGEVIATLGAGDQFGEVALMVTGQRSADVRARTPGRLIVVFERDVKALDRVHPELGRALRAASGPRMPGAASS
jgi:CRP-like cAMP-binding protein